MHNISRLILSIYGSAHAPRWSHLSVWLCLGTLAITSRTNMICHISTLNALETYPPPVDRTFPIASHSQFLPGRAHLCCVVIPRFLSESVDTFLPLFATQILLHRERQSDSAHRQPLRRQKSASVSHSEDFSTTRVQSTHSQPDPFPKRSGR